ncbi:uncharacterized protein METZ01_LOCUS203935 [marine metagenome]|uniref:Aspartate aminotransferase family protein n=1 Tax=marine metagenome TaxID=408172 RepID=A0A382EMA0_9ZZZZ
MQQTVMNTPDALWRPMTQHKPMQGKDGPSKIVRGEGCFLIDDQGRRHLDGLAGLWCVNIGYGREELADVAREQMGELCYAAPVLTTGPPVALSDKLLKMLEFERGHCYFTSSGSEANETAFKIARQFHLQTGNPRKYKIISRHRAYHGNTMATMTATGQAERKVGYDPMAAGFLHIPPPYPYRAHPKFTAEEHGEECAKFLEETINYEGAETVAAFIMEPMISGGGVLVPPDNYLPMVREVCDRHQVLLIHDEVVSGFGRTGRMFGHHHWGGKPDIITLAKGISSGYLPLAATVVREEIFEAFYGDPGTLNHFRQINTYGGHPVSTAVGLRNIEIIEREKLTVNAEKMGSYLQGKLEKLLDHPYVGEVRGKGLLLGIELVSDKTEKTAMAADKANLIVQHCAKNGVMIGRNGNTIPGLCNVLILAPPLIISEGEADQLVDAITIALQRSLN